MKYYSVIHKVYQHNIYEYKIGLSVFDFIAVLANTSTMCKKIIVYVGILLNNDRGNSLIFAITMIQFICYMGSSYSVKVCTAVIVRRNLQRSANFVDVHS